MEDGILEIVIVEDDPNDAELILRVLRKHHLANEIIVLKDGAEAVDFFFADKQSARRARAVFLDLKLPKIDGIEVLRRLKSDERTRDLPVVILTSSKEERDLDEAYKLGVNSYVTKAIAFEDFAKVVAELGLYWLVLNKMPAR